VISITPVITIMDTSVLLAKLHLAQTQAQHFSNGAPASVVVPGVADPVAAIEKPIWIPF
jgi:HlyD family secretion protein